ncbi:MAG: GFA family protein, partial [Solirubrobacteraceae bacterium]
QALPRGLTMSEPAPITAGCLCGGVRFVLSAAPVVAGYCHCTRCQRRTGTSSSAQAIIAEDTLTLVAGADLVQGWRHPDGGMEKCFCRVCGAHLFSRHPQTKVPRAVRMSAFDADPGVRPSFRCFVAYAAPWEPIRDDGLERFPDGWTG